MSSTMGQEELVAGRDLLVKVYSAFNRRDVESILA